MISSNNELPPEYRKAISFLETILKEKTITLPIKAEITDKVLQEGNFLLTSKKFRTRDIPSGEYWKWNQSKGRYTVKLKDCEVVFHKLIPRTINKMYKSPRMKIWCFKLSMATGKSVRALWCERGYTKQPNLEELEFLKDFMPQQVANEIWPSSVKFQEQPMDHSQLKSIDTELSQLLFSTELDPEWINQY